MQEHAEELRSRPLRLCHHCGHRLSPDTAVCPNCGTALEPESSRTAKQNDAEKQIERQTRK